MKRIHKIKTFIRKKINFNLLTGILLLFSLIISWKMIRYKNSISKDTHTVIQKNIKKIILQSIKDHNPYSNNIHIKKISTKEINPSLIQANFSYSYEDTSADEKTKVHINGKAKVKKNELPSNLKEFWTVNDLHILENEILFEKGLTINN